MNRSEPFVSWIAAMPKAELHVHIDGTLQPSRLLDRAAKHGVDIPYRSVEDVENAYDFDNLQSFLDLYYLGTGVIRDEEDFYLLMLDYLSACREQHITHTEIMVEPQSYLPNGVALETLMSGFQRAIDEAKAGWGQSVVLILSLLRHLPEADGIEVLEQAHSTYSDRFVAIGLASAEVGHPPDGFAGLYARARSLGYRATAHAGEEGPAAFVTDSLDLLGVERIDHGVRSADDPALIARLARERIPLTVCPLSNVKLKVFENMTDHNILELLDAGVRVTVNSDDPTYFGGFLNDNFIALHEDLKLSREQATRLNRNAFEASFLPEDVKAALLADLDRYLLEHPVR
ncbi:MAG: adenosine deaminase [Gammaproteobacteria bacterium]|nr:adenosine deaminase [Gammaproteobacteria bacterium]